jgi:hypothetical protein
MRNVNTTIRRLTYFEKPLPSTLITIQQLSSRRWLRSKFLTYSNRDCAMAHNTRKVSDCGELRIEGEKKCHAPHAMPMPDHEKYVGGWWMATAQSVQRLFFSFRFRLFRQ